jgi:hypothetical protein
VRGLVTNTQPVPTADDAGLAVVELDGQGGFGDVDGNGLPAVGPAEGYLLAADGDDAGIQGSALDGEGSVEGRGGGPAGRTPRRCQVLSAGIGLSGGCGAPREVEGH